MRKNAQQLNCGRYADRLMLNVSQTDTYPCRPHCREICDKVVEMYFKQYAVVLVDEQIC
jgi:hypothetical protein